MSKEKNNGLSPNDDEPASEIGGKQVVTHDAFLDLQIDKAVAAKLRSMTLNEVNVGCSITDKRTSSGKPKKDSQGNETGEFWADSYTVELSFEGGRFTTRVDAPTYASLEMGGVRYTAKGALESKVNEYGFSVPSVKILSFARLF